MRSVISSALEAVGLTSITAGAWTQFGSGWGLMVAGVACVVVGVRNAK